MKIAIIKYGMGNVASVQKALGKLRYDSTITDNHDEIKNADFLILPGVGSFKKGMENLTNSGLVDLLTQEVIGNKKPFLGICLGMQLIAKTGTEPIGVEGLGWVDGEVVQILSSELDLRVPHLGWNTLHVKNKHDRYLEFENQDCYFIHSYHFLISNPEEILFTVNYGREIVAGIKKDNIHAMQFHPEKSQEVGLNLMKKVISQYA